MTMQNDLRTADQLHADIRTCDSLLAMIDHELRELRTKRERIYQDLKHAQERLWVLDHEFAGAGQETQP